MPRDDDRTINYIAPQVKWFNQHKEAQCKDVLAYIEQTDSCNQRFLLAYFGETLAQDCGICSHLYSAQAKSPLKRANSDHFSRVTNPHRLQPHDLSRDMFRFFLPRMGGATSAHPTLRRGKNKAITQ